MARGSDQFKNSLQNNRKNEFEKDYRKFLNNPPCGKMI